MLLERGWMKGRKRSYPPFGWSRDARGPRRFRFRLDGGRDGDRSWLVRRVPPPPRLREKSERDGLFRHGGGDGNLEVYRGSYGVQLLHDAGGGVLFSLSRLLGVNGCFRAAGRTGALSVWGEMAAGGEDTLVM